MVDNALREILEPEYKLEKLKEYLFERIDKKNLFDKNHPNFSTFLMSTYKKCFYCQKEVHHLTKDHIVPKKNHGTDEIINLVPACKNCNQWKGSKTLEEWLLEVYTSKSDCKVDYAVKYNEVRKTNIIRRIKLLLKHVKENKEKLKTNGNRD